MLRTIIGKVVWLTKGAALFGGAVVTLALVFGVATMALGANGQNFILGRTTNAATAITKLTGNVQGAAFQVQNTNPGTDDTALNLTVQPGESPMRVTSAGKVANLNADQLDGKDFSSAFNVQLVIDGRGPLPLQNSFTSQGGDLLISASGSGFRSLAFARGAGNIGMDVFVDGSYRGTVGVSTNERDSRKAFVSESLVIQGLPAGSHTIRLEARNDSTCNTANETFDSFCTTTNNDDRFNVAVLEIPN